MRIESVAKKISENGGRLYLVGGAVRDKLLNKVNCDEDYCVTGLTTEDFEKIFPEAIKRGRAFEVYDLEGSEFALARYDIKEAPGHKGFKVVTGRDIAIEQDLKRRDITINAIAKDVLTEEIIDPFNGIEDIRNKIIRATSQSFIEDPLRAYRVARFASEFEFEVEENTIGLMRGLRDELPTLSKERVFTEFRKALKSTHPSIFFEVLRKAEILDVHFKEIYHLIGAIQPIKYHPEGDSYNHTLIALENCCRLTDNVVIRFSTLVHDLGKGETPKDMYPHHYGHAKRGIGLVKKLGNRIGVPKVWVKCGATGCFEHMRGGLFYKMSVKKQVDFIEKVDKSLLGLQGLQIVVYSDRNRTGEYEYEKDIDEQYNFYDIGKKMLSEVDGEYIKREYNISEGVEFGIKLREERIKWMSKNQK